METLDMALDLQDLGAIKVHQEVHALIKASAMAEKTEVVAKVREILHEWARLQFDTYTLANEIAKAKGLSGITGDWK